MFAATSEVLVYELHELSVGSGTHTMLITALATAEGFDAPPQGRQAGLRHGRGDAGASKRQRECC
jgi:hypothetical protein